MDSEQQQCLWDVEYNECSYQEVSPNLKSVVLLSMILTVAISPFNFLIDMVFVNVLLAPTAKDIDSIGESSISKAGATIARQVRRASNAVVAGVNSTGRRASALISRAGRMSSRNSFTTKIEFAKESNKAGLLQVGIRCIL